MVRILNETEIETTPVGNIDPSHNNNHAMNLNLEVGESDGPGIVLPKTPCCNTGISKHTHSDKNVAVDTGPNQSVVNISKDSIKEGSNNHCPCDDGSTTSKNSSEGTKLQLDNCIDENSIESSVTVNGEASLNGSTRTSDIETDVETTGCFTNGDGDYLDCDEVLQNSESPSVTPTPLVVVENVDENTTVILQNPSFGLGIENQDNNACSTAVQVKNSSEQGDTNCKADSKIPETENADLKSVKAEGQVATETVLKETPEVEKSSHPITKKPVLEAQTGTPKSVNKVLNGPKEISKSNEGTVASTNPFSGGITLTASEAATEKSKNLAAAVKKACEELASKRENSPKTPSTTHTSSSSASRYGNSSSYKQNRTNSFPHHFPHSSFHQYTHSSFHENPNHGNFPSSSHPLHHQNHPNPLNSSSHHAGGMMQFLSNHQPPNFPGINLPHGRNGPHIGAAGAHHFSGMPPPRPPPFGFLNEAVSPGHSYPPPPVGQPPPMPLIQHGPLVNIDTSNGAPSAAAGLPTPLPTAAFPLPLDPNCPPAVLPAQAGTTQSSGYSTAGHSRSSSPMGFAGVQMPAYSAMEASTGGRNNGIGPVANPNLVFSAPSSELTSFPAIPTLPGQYVVYFHINPGVSVSFNVMDQIQVIKGMYTCFHLPLCFVDL